MENVKIFKRCEHLIKEEARDAKREIDNEKIELFKNICDMVDDIIIRGDALRIAVRVSAKLDEIEFTIHLSSITVQDLDDKFPMLVGYAKKINMRGVPETAYEELDMEAVELKIAFDGVWS